MSSLNMGEILEKEYYNEIDTSAKEQFINNILYDMELLTDGRQLNTLNKKLNSILENFDIICDEINDDEIRDWKEYNEHIINKFKETKELEGCSPRTIMLYMESVKALLKFLDKSIIEITTDDVRDWLYYKYDVDKISPVTLDNYRRCLNSFFQFLTLENYIRRNPVKKINRIKPPKRIKEPFTGEDIVHMRNHVRSFRDLAIFEMLLSSGVRVGELVNIDIKDLNFQENSVWVIGKGNKERKTYFSDECKVAVKEYLDYRSDDNPALFVSNGKPYNRLRGLSVGTMVRELGLAAGVKKAHPHRFRRTMATNCLNKGMPIEQVKELLGHESIDTTTIYAIVDEDTVNINHRKLIG